MRGKQEKPVMLYIEDDDSAVFLLQEAIEEVHIPVELFRVSNGEQALAWLNQDGLHKDALRPDLILLDLNIPKKSGLEVLAEIHASANLRSIPVVVFSSSSLGTDRQQSLELGARSYIQKPATFVAFVEAVRAACSFLPSDC